jgi:hypothetical protein
VSYFLYLFNKGTIFKTLTLFLVLSLSILYAFVQRFGSLECSYCINEYTCTSNLVFTESIYFM